MGKNLNSNLTKAKKEKNDEFYTQYVDVEKELSHYTAHFKDKVVYCNCDNPIESNFCKYFISNFEILGLKKLIVSCYVKDNLGCYLEYEGNEIIIKKFKSDGDFKSEECIELLKQADIVVTNPPFSLFREYVAQLVEYNKKFLIVGHQNAITYKGIFPLIKNNKLWLGIDNGGIKWFKVQNHYDIETKTRIKIEEGQKYFSMGSVIWFTNLNNIKQHTKVLLSKTYFGNEIEYPTYDNYNAIEVSKVANIPKDFKGNMGVPITFIDKYNSEQFEILKLGKSNDNKLLEINGKYPYARIIIKHKELINK